MARDQVKGQRVVSHDTIIPSIYQPLKKICEIRTTSGMMRTRKRGLKMPSQSEQLLTPCILCNALTTLENVDGLTPAASQLFSGQRPTLGTSPGTQFPSR